MISEIELKHGQSVMKELDELLCYDGLEHLKRIRRIKPADGWRITNCGQRFKRYPEFHLRPSRK